MSAVLDVLDRRGGALLGAAGALTLIVLLVALNQGAAATALGLLTLIALRTQSALQALATTRRLADHPANRAWRFLGACWLLAAVSGVLVLSVWILRGVLPPIPSLSDLFLLAGYCSALWGLASYSSFLQEGFGRLRGWLDVTILIVAVIGLSWLALVQPVLAAGIVPSIQVFWAMLWPSLDLCLLVLILRAALLARAGPERRSLGLLGLAGAAALAWHLVASFSVLTGETTLTSRIAVFSMAAALLASGAAVQAGRIGPSSAASGRPRTRAASAEAFLPIAFTYLVVGFTAVDAWLQGNVDQLGMGISIALMLLLFARQGVVAGQSEMRQYAALVDGAADMAFICQPGGKITLGNPSFAAALRRSTAKMAGLRLQDVLEAEVDSRAILDQAANSSWQGEVQLRRSDGSAFPARLSLRPVLLERQRRPVLAASAVDLTLVKERERLLRSALDDVAAARAELEILNRGLEVKVEARTEELRRTVEDLDRLNRELLELDRLKSEFVTLVSHELRAPLTNIRAGVELLLPEDAGMPAAAHDSLQLILDETERLGEFVGAILDLSALEAGRFPLTLETVDLRLQALAAAERFRTVEDYGRIVVRLESDLPYVLADERALASVLYHLLDNAVKYAPLGEILLEAEAQPGRLLASISDHGPGIPESDREQVFDMFHRLDTSDAQEVYGHGLGLHLVRRLLAAMGGAVWAEEADGGGARLVFWLPLADRVDEPEQAEPRPAAGHLDQRRETWQPDC
jgi:PAS domain S-box-containing protein